jgi:hypothetical protein
VLRLLIVHHTPSPATHALLESVRAGATDPRIEGVEVVVRAALSATSVDVLGADGFLLGTPANLGYMSGALKHFFDQIYYPCLEDTKGRPYGLYVHGASDTTGAVRAVEKVTTGLQWKLAQPVLEVTGSPDKAVLEQAWELGRGVRRRARRGPLGRRLTEERRQAPLARGLRTCCSSWREGRRGVGDLVEPGRATRAAPTPPGGVGPTASKGASGRCR